VTDFDLQQTPRSADREWRGMTPLRTGAELLLGVSFFVAVAFGAAGVRAGHTSIVAELAAIAFLASLTCVLVNWFTAAPEEPRGWE
jgi:hypothetical protein